MRIWLLALLLVLGGLAAASWCWHADEIAPAAPAAATTAGNPAATAASDAAATPAAPAALDLESDGDDTPAADRVLSEVAAAHGPKVQVVGGDPIQPIAGAEVFCVTAADAERRQPGRAEPHRFTWPEAFGQRFTTEADGVVQLPPTAAPWLCAARSEGRFAFREVPPQGRLVTLHLVRDESLRLAARREGRPVANAPLLVLQQFGTDQASPIWSGTSGADGGVLLRHFQLLRQQRQQPPGPQFGAVAKVVGATLVPFVGDPAVDSVVEVPVPDVASLRVTLVDHRGTPVLSPATVGHFGGRPPTLPADAGWRLDRMALAQRADKPPGTDPVTLPFTELGTSLRVLVRYPHERRHVEFGPVPGPTAAGERVDVTVPLGPQLVLLAGRLVDGSGRPFDRRDRPVHATVWRGERNVVDAAVDSLADGRFDLVLGQRTDASEFWLELRHEVPGPPPAAGEPAVPSRLLGARVHLRGLRGGDRLELGDIALVDLPSLCSGWVENDEGAPVGDATVEVQQLEPPQPRREPAESWRPLPHLRASSAADGSFAIVGHQPLGTLRVRADNHLHFADSLPLQQAGQVLRIRLQRNGILRGRALLPEWSTDGMLSLQLQPFDAAARQRDTRTVELSRSRGGRFVIEPVRPGRYDLRVLLRNVPEPLLVLTDLFINAGEQRDRRLQPLDLRHVLHRYRLRAVDAQGSPFAPDGPILAKLVLPTGGTSEAAFRWREGRAELITPSPMAEVTCFGRGVRTTRVPLTPGDHDIVLPRLRPALVELPGLRNLCGPNRAVRISAILQGDTGLPGSLSGTDQRTGESFGFARWDLGRTSGGWLGPTDTVEIPLLQGGRYQLLLRPHATDTRSPQAELALATVELDLERHAFRPLRVDLDALGVATLLQQLDQRAQAQRDAGNRPPGRPREPR
jgi:hypothetical protein